MDIKDVEREEKSIKAQDTRREGAEGFAAADILGELFNNDEGTKADVAPAEAISSENGEGDNAMPCVTSDDNAAAPTCESADESAVDGEVTTANAADESIESTDAASGESAEVIDTEIENGTSPSGDECDTDDGQIAINLGDGVTDASLAEATEKGMTDEMSDEQGEATDNEACDTAEATESKALDTSEEAIPSPDEISEEEKEPKELDEEIERELFYQETRDHEHTERLSPTPALELATMLVDMISLYPEIPVSKICIELSADILYEDLKLAAEKIDELRELGFKIAIFEVGDEFCPVFRLSEIKFDYAFMDNYSVDSLDTDAAERVAGR